ncbi:MAG: hypothetical protein KGI58_00280 [Patescibacteria group bacterium]|nr:hypothetical protein [Patescibacteria group bacterium]
MSYNDEEEPKFSDFEDDDDLDFGSDSEDPQSDDLLSGDYDEPDEVADLDGSMY